MEWLTYCTTLFICLKILYMLNLKDMRFCVFCLIRKIYADYCICRNQKNSCKSFVFTAVFQCLTDVIRNVQAKTFRAP